ncbi:MAG: zinc-ribbon domain-containing protein [Gemmobacter sp.]
MRLVCPNCDAQYEVSDSAIPDGGRDVQCSNCGHSWYQLPSGAADAADEADEAQLYGQTDPAPNPATAEIGDNREPAHAEPAEHVETFEPAPQAATAAGPAAVTLPEAPPKRALDAAVLAVLREEAERETAARRAEAARGVEVQPDLGLAAAAPAASHRGSPEATQPPHAQRSGARRDLLPDIEEINSTLRAGSEARAGVEVAEAITPRASGFGAGFVTVLLVAAALVLAYVMAPRIAEYLPGSAAAMERYVAVIDGARLWLDGALQVAVRQLRGLSGQDI